MATGHSAQFPADRKHKFYLEGSRDLFVRKGVIPLLLFGIQRFPSIYSDATRFKLTQQPDVVLNSHMCFWNSLVNANSFLLGVSHGIAVTIAELSSLMLGFHHRMKLCFLVMYQWVLAILSE